MLEAAKKRRKRIGKRRTNKQGKKIEGVLIRIQDLKKKREIIINRKKFESNKCVYRR